jgi:L-fucose dehydrogenase
MSSNVALTGHGNASAYAAAKGASLALAREWAVELLKYEIRVNAILPAAVMTPLLEQEPRKFPNVDERLSEIRRQNPGGESSDDHGRNSEHGCISPFGVRFVNNRKNL